ncbi:hypothetical protein [Curtobacterium aurantiacum]|uniref:hypothetical protein n=1 Tax=Curtobacterium aurantiacum TaxID=3236919 RepID=UPI001BE075E9|nr:hypothetical protein [Curtobacterium flaccumfaciens]MBT1676790.1 hypothetical protein [Curtobacterium flaccumfaciens pv. flaccumfaciens]
MSDWKVRSTHTNRSTARTSIWERENDVRNGVAHGLSDNQIAQNIGICSETVARIRRRLKLPNFYGKYSERAAA